MANKTKVAMGQLRKDLLSHMYLKEVAIKHNISSSWASILRRRLGAYKRVPKECPFCKRNLHGHYV